MRARALPTGAAPTLGLAWTAPCAPPLRAGSDTCCCRADCWLLGPSRVWLDPCLSRPMSRTWSSWMRCCSASRTPPALEMPTSQPPRRGSRLLAVSLYPCPGRWQPAERRECWGLLHAAMAGSLLHAWNPGACLCDVVNARAAFTQRALRNTNTSAGLNVTDRGPADHSVGFSWRHCALPCLALSLGRWPGALRQALAAAGRRRAPENEAQRSLVAESRWVETSQPLG